MSAQTGQAATRARLLTLACHSWPQSSHRHHARCLDDGSNSDDDNTAPARVQ